MNNIENSQLYNHGSTDRLIGVQPERNEEVFALLNEQKYTKDQLIINGSHHELDKTPEDLELIAFADKVSNDIIQNYGGNCNKKIPIDRIHLWNHDVIDSGIFNYFCSPTDSIFIVKEYVSNQLIVHALVHEMIHYKAFNSQNITYSTSNKVQATDRRVGLRIFTKNGQKYFSAINEAVVEELNRRYYIEHENEFLNNPLLHDEVQKVIDYRKMLVDVHNGVYKIPESVKLEFEHQYSIRDEYYGLTSDERILDAYYIEERKKLNEYIDNLVKDQTNNSESDIDNEKVFELFARAAINGNILPLARLIDKTYGTGSFVKLGEETKDDIS